VVERVLDGLMRQHPNLEIPVVDIGAVFATHVGPGCVGVAFVQEGDFLSV
jgi:fatty acid-binding protein DegV